MPVAPEAGPGASLDRRARAGRLESHAGGRPTASGCFGGQGAGSGQFEVLGAAVYVRGHLRRYAELLGLPAAGSREVVFGVASGALDAGSAARRGTAAEIGCREARAAAGYGGPRCAGDRDHRRGAVGPARAAHARGALAAGRERGNGQSAGRDAVNATDATARLRRRHLRRSARARRHRGAFADAARRRLIPRAFQWRAGTLWAPAVDSAARRSPVDGGGGVSSEPTPTRRERACSRQGAAARTHGTRP